MVRHLTHGWKTMLVNMAWKYPDLVLHSPCKLRNLKCDGQYFYLIPVHY